MSGEGVPPELSCERCGDAFLFSPGERRFFARKGFPPPRRCPACREALREAEAKQAREDAWSPRHALCDACGAAFELPFVPSEARPVYCAECFRHR